MAYFVKPFFGWLCVINCKFIFSYLAGTEDGHIHRCSCSYNEQFLESYHGHTVSSFLLPAKYIIRISKYSISFTGHTWHFVQHGHSVINRHFSLLNVNISFLIKKRNRFIVHKISLMESQGGMLLIAQRWVNSVLYLTILTDVFIGILYVVFLRAQYIRSSGRHLSRMCSSVVVQTGVLDCGIRINLDLSLISSLLL